MQKLPMEFRSRTGKDLQPDGVVAFYGIAKDGVEFGESYASVDELIRDFERVLVSAKEFKDARGK